MQTRCSKKEKWVGERTARSAMMYGSSANHARRTRHGIRLTTIFSWSPPKTARKPRLL
jgi:hypothetical protein